MGEQMGQKKVPEWRTLSKLCAFLRPYWKTACLLLSCALLLALLGALSPFITHLLVDDYLVKGEVKKVMQTIGLLAGLLVAQGLVQFFHIYLAERVGQHVIRDIRVKLYSRIQNLPVRFFDKTPVGQLITRCVSDVEALSTVFNTGVASILADALQIFVIAALMFTIHWKMALVVFTLLPFLIVISYVFKEKTKIAFQKVRQAVAGLNTFAQEHITGMNIVQIFTAEQQEKEKFRHINGDHRRANLQAVYYYSVYFPVIELLQAASIGLLVWYGVEGIVEEKILPGMLIAFIMYVHMLYRPFRMIADKFNTLQIGLVSANKIFSLLHQARPHKPEPKKSPIVSLRGDIVFHGIHFSYEEGTEVLHDINLLIPAAKTVAIVGKTGAGKSSLVQLLNAFYTPQKGFITIGGEKLEACDVHHLRRRIGFIMQESFLFSDSIRNNILLHEQDTPGKEQQEMLNRLAREIGIDKWISALPGGWAFNVLEQGGLLSTGQRQLLSILRVLAQDPDIIIMDEATASIDSSTERAIQKALRVLIKGRTAIIVAHRLSTIRHAEKIVVMDAGKIEETGTHKSLMAKKGPYHALHETQLNPLTTS